MDCVYAEGEYHFEKGVPPAGSAVGLVSEGDWGSLQIPYLGSDYAIPGRRDVYVTMGGEISLSLPFLDKYEPHRLGLVLIAESVVQTPEKLLPSDQEALAEILATQNIFRADVSLADVAGVAADAVSFCRNSIAETVTGVALGSKSHAVGLGLAALSEPNMEIVCRVPQRYRNLDVPATGKVAYYEIEDRFEPGAYF